MAVIYEDRPRQIVPRWRLFDETIRRGELLPASEVTAPRFTEEMVAGQLFDWAKTPTLSVASDLVSVAFTLGLDSAAIDAAQFVLADPTAPATARSIAGLYLRSAGSNLTDDSGKDESPDELLTPGRILTLDDRKLVLRAHAIRGRLTEYPRNPILWCNLSLLYTSLGVTEKAERAIRAALWLAPDNRFILRSASRFYLHQGQKDRAHQVVSDSPLVRSDPWILAAEIATADALGKSSTRIRLARKTLESGNYRALHLSEVASAIGTIDLKAGRTKAGRRTIEASLLEPSENSVAQAAWLSRNVVELDVPDLQRSPEAYACFTWSQARWETSLEQASKWLRDQPFSSRPAIHASFIASTVYEDYLQALTFAGLGLRSNPTDNTLLNNFAFASAKLGNVREAEKKIRLADVKSMRSEERIAYKATRGLIAFRSGHPALGRLLYNEAIRLARAKGHESHEIFAKIYLAMEESRIGSPAAVDLRREAIAMASSRLVAIIGRTLVEQIKRFDVASDPNKVESSP